MKSQVEGNLLLILIICSVFIATVHSYKCLSCYYGCPDMMSCECVNSTTSSCEGDFCFVSIKQVEQDSDVSVIFKGCANEVPEDLLGCQYAGDRMSIECYCQGDNCNNARALEAYQPKAQPAMQCCACDPLNEEEDIGCSPNDCYRSCTGHFCYVNMAKQTQGCGLGYPKDFALYRTKSLNIWNNSSFSCGLSVAGPPDLASWHRECTCREDNCNMVQPAYEHDVNYTQREDVKQMYCYSLTDASVKPITIDSYKKSGYCEGHYCYVTIVTNTWLTTIKNVPSIQLKYEVVAGCLLVDNQTKVSVGCTTEWTTDKTTPFKKHCVCEGDYCNLFTLINGESKSKYRVFVPPGSSAIILAKMGSFLILCCLVFIFCTK